MAEGYKRSFAKALFLAPLVSLLKVVVSLFILVFAALFALLGTETGSNFILSQARDNLEPYLHYETASGSFVSGLTLQKAQSVQAGQRILAETAILDIDLFSPHIDVLLNNVSHRTVADTKPPTSSLKPKSKNAPPRINSPIPITANININGFSSDRAPKFIGDLDNIQLAASLFGRTFSIVQLTANNSRWQSQGNFSLRLDDYFYSNASLLINGSFADKPQEIILQANGPLSQLDITLRANGSNSASATAKVNLRSQPLSWQADIADFNINLADFTGNKPIIFSGALNSFGELNNAEAQGYLNMDLPFNSGKIEQFKAENIALKWVNKTLSLNDLKLHSPYANFLADINLDIDQSLALNAKAEGEITPPGLYPQPINIDLSGSLKTIVAKLNFANAPAGDFALNGELDLVGHKQPRWLAAVTSKSLDLSKLVKNTPSLIISSDLSSEGWVNAAQLSGRLETKQANRHLKFDDFTIEWSPQTWELLPSKLQSSLVANATVVSGIFNAGKGQDATLRVDLTGEQTAVNLHGSVHPQLDLAWTANVEELATLLPLASGKINSTGSIQKTDANSLQLDGSFYAEALQFANSKVASINAEATVSTNISEALNINIAAKNLSFGNIQYREATLLGNGSLEKHQLAVNLDSDFLSVKTNVRGNIVLAKGQSFSTAEWSGLVENWQSFNPQLPVAELQSPVPVFISSKKIALQNGCWDLGYQQLESAVICFDALWDRANKKHINLNGEINNLPLSAFGATIPQGKIHGLAHGRFNADIAWPPLPNQPAVAQATLDISNTKVARIVSGKPYTLGAFPKGSANIVWDNSKLGVDIQLLMANGGKLLLRPEINQGLSSTLSSLLEDSKSWQRLPLTGKVNWDIPELIILPVFAPQLESIEGFSTGDIQLAGSIGNPKFSGEAVAKANNVSIPDLGLELSKLDIEMRPLVHGLDINAVAVSKLNDTNLLSASGQVYWEPEFNAKLLIIGKEFPAMTTPEMSFVVSPELQLELAKNKVQYGGDLLVNKAYIAPRNLSGVERPSRDQIFEDKRSTDKSLDLSGRLNITLGEKVTLKSSGLYANLEGDITIVDSPGKRTRGIGEINIKNGHFSAFGQRLTIDPGTLIFQDADIADPALDAKAIRRLPDVTVGVSIRGTVSQPEVELFSEPLLSQTDTLSYLVLGRAIEDGDSDDTDALDKAISAVQLTGAEFLARNLREKLGINLFKVEVDDAGKAALVMSKYLSPRFYISYGLDAFDAETRMLMRYDLSESWKLEAESNGKVSGGDLIFTIETD